MSRINLVQGEDVTITVRISTEDGDPYDFTGYTEVTAVFTQAAGTCLSKLETAGDITVVLPITSGKAEISLDDADTLSLETGTTGFELIIDKGAHPGGERRIVQFKNSLNVLERLCS